MVMVSTAADGESTACQEVIEVSSEGVFETKVAVTSGNAQWSVLVSACDAGRSCRDVHVTPPGERSDKGCRVAAMRIAPSDQTLHPDKTRSKCTEHTDPCSSGTAGGPSPFPFSFLIQVV